MRMAGAVVHRHRQGVHQGVLAWASGEAAGTDPVCRQGARRELVWNLGLVATGLAMSMAIAIAALMPGNALNPTASRVPVPDLVELRPGSFPYRARGEFTRDGKPARAPVWNVTFTRTLAVMRHQVTEAEYWRCAKAEACPMIDRQAAADDRPMVNVNWHDAQAYAAWLSRETGARFRLPTDVEWAYAAGGRFVDDALPEAAYGDDPGRRALAIYDGPSRNRGIDKVSQPVGTFGANERGLVDLAGNVWEWPTAVSCAPRSRQVETFARPWSIAACAWSKAHTGPMSRISSAMPSRAAVRSARRRAISACGWCATTAEVRLPLI